MYFDSHGCTGYTGELFAKFATGQVILPANVMFCLFQYRVRPGEKCGFTTKSTKVTKRFFRNPSRDAGCEDIHAGRRPSAGSDNTKLACRGRFSWFRSFCVFVPFVAIPGKDPAAAFCKRLRIISEGPVSCSPENSQARAGSSTEPPLCAATSRPVYPVHPVYRCFIISINEQDLQDGLSRRLPVQGEVIPPGSAGVPPASFSCQRTLPRHCFRAIDAASCHQR